MTNITKHDGKQERERDNGEQTRVDLAVTRNTIGIDDVLEALGEFVGAVVSGGCFLGRELGEDGGQVRTRRLGRGLERVLNDGDIVLGTPALGNQTFAVHVVVEEVHGVVYSLLLAHHRGPCRQILGNLEKLGATRLARVGEDLSRERRVRSYANA